MTLSRRSFFAAAAAAPFAAPVIASEIGKLQAGGIFHPAGNYLVGEFCSESIVPALSGLHPMENLIREVSKIIEVELSVERQMEFDGVVDLSGAAA